MMKTLIFDTETTGLTLPSVADPNKQPRIIEIGALLVEGEKVIQEVSQLINPEIDIPKKITKITGIKDEDVQDQPIFADFSFELSLVFEKADQLICHNAPFDVAVLKHNLVHLAKHPQFPWPKEIICTVAEYTHELGKYPKLTELYSHVIGKELKQTHRALDDCKALHEILIAGGYFDG
jgi:DNA polymerase III epsilon subunit-like protein